MAACLSADRAGRLKHFTKLAKPCPEGTPLEPLANHFMAGITNPLPLLISEDFRYYNPA